MALLDPDRKKAGPAATPRERLGLDEDSSAKSSTSRVGKMVSGTPLGTPQSPMAEVDDKSTGVDDSTSISTNASKPKIKKKEVGVGQYNV